MIFPPHYSELILNQGITHTYLMVKAKRKMSLTGKRQQHAHGKKLKRQILKQTRARQDLLLKFILREQTPVKLTQAQGRVANGSS